MNMNLHELHKLELSFMLRLKHKSQLWAGSTGLTTAYVDALVYESGYQGIEVSKLHEFFRTECEQGWLAEFSPEEFCIESKVS